jgi:hypothetical protein
MPLARRSHATRRATSRSRHAPSVAGNNANFYYVHFARAHYKENVLNGGGPQTDDSILENYNRTKKKMKSHTFHGGARRKGHKWKVKIAVQDRDQQGRLIPDSYHFKTYWRKAPIADFESVHRRCAISKRIARKRGALLSLRPSAKMEHVKDSKDEARKGWNETTGSNLKALKERVS